MAVDRILRGAFVLLLTSLIASIPLFAQKITGDISGTVTDPSGAAVSGAVVNAVNAGTNEKASATTNEAGFYRMVNLSPGQYRVSVEAPGFKGMERQATVSLALVTESNFTLVVGSKGETVEVQSVVPLVETTEDRLSTLFDDKLVADLPNNGGDFNNLLDGVPGVQRSPGGGFQSLNINGQRATSNNFAVDGIPNNDRYYGESSLGQAAIAGTAAALIPLDGISEFNVQSNPGVEYGVRGGSVIDIGLKSGTNQLHGTVFWDRHTDAFDARNYFSAEKTPFRLNQYGASGGFPIRKDKDFVYLSFQGFHLKSVFPAVEPVPTPAEIVDATECVMTGTNHNTSGGSVVNAAGDPLCLNQGQPGPGPDQIFGNGDDGQVSTIGANLLSFIPTSDTGLLNISGQNKLDVTNFHVKFDHIFNQNHRVSVKYLFGDSLNNQPASPGTPQTVGPLATNQNMWNSVAPSRAQLIGINYNWTISTNKVLESRLGYQRFSQRIGVNNNIDPNALGINTGPLGAGPQDTENFGVPAVYYLGEFGPSANAYPVVGGIQGYPIITRPNASYDWQEHFTEIKGNHTIKIGGQFQRATTKTRRDRARTGLSFYSYGFSYCATYGPCPTEFGSASQTNHVAALNELLLGLTDDVARSFGETNRHIYQNSLGLYVQDSWKVKPNFTLELGVRWDVAGALGEKNNLGANFLPGNPKADSDGFVSLSKQPLYGVDKNNFGPRVGVAWDLFKNGKTVLRSGYSLNYDLPNFGALHAPQTYLPGGSWSGTRSGFFTQFAEGIYAVDVFASTPSSNQDIFNSGTQDNSLCTVFVCMATGVNIFGSEVLTKPPPPFNVVQVLHDFRTPMNHAYNLTVEQALTDKVSFMVAYVGTAGRNLLNWRDLNACPISPDPCNTSRQPFGATFPQYRHIMQVNNDGYSNYNSLQTAFKVRDTHGLTGQVNFTWSRAFDTGSANRGGDLLSNFQNPYRVSANYAPSGFDTPLNVNFTVVYQIPRLQGVPRLVGEGWQLNSIFRAQKGRPFSAYVHADPSHQGIKNSYADYDGSPLNYAYDNIHQFLNVDAFSSPADGAVGTARRNMLRQPGISQWDMSIFKNFKFQERYTVQFSWSVFNVLNHSMFAANTGDIGSRNCDPPDSNNCSGFGAYFATPDVGLGFNPILGTGAQRNMQFGLRFSF